MILAGVVFCIATENHCPHLESAPNSQLAATMGPTASSASSGTSCSCRNIIFLLLLFLLPDGCWCSDTNLEGNMLRNSLDTLEDVQRSSSRLASTEQQQDAPAYQDELTIQGLSARNLHKKLDVDSLFDGPVKDWSLQQWVAFFIVALIALCALRCLCSLIRCILSWLRALCCGGYRRGYYEYAAPGYAPPPAYNPSYVNNNRSVYTNGGYYAPRGNDCTCMDLLGAACCLNCCTNGGNGGFSDAMCGLCCFEFCCRGGRDVVGGGSVQQYGSFV